ncbi:hypothetical protein D3C71_2150220 [compost metagenome]
MIAPTAPLTEPTRVPLAVSPVLPGWLPVTLPAAKSWPSLFRSRAFSYTVTSVSLTALRQLLYTSMVMVVVLSSPSASRMV